jgi:hypothetical protein
VLGARPTVEGVARPYALAPALRTQRPDRLRDELASIQAAIDLVASGGARRIVLVGLRFGERLMPDAVIAGQSAGLSVHLDRGRTEQPAMVVTRSGRATAA